MTRAYKKSAMAPTTLERKRIVFAWYKAKLKLGTMKTIANQIGCSEGVIEQIIKEIREDVIEEISREDA